MGRAIAKPITKIKTQRYPLSPDNFLTGQNSKRKIRYLPGIVISPETFLQGDKP